LVVAVSVFLLFDYVDGEVPAAMHDWKDIPGGN